MPTKKDYKRIIEDKLAENEKNQRKTGAGDSSENGGTGDVPIKNRKEYE